MKTKQEYVDLLIESGYEAHLSDGILSIHFGEAKQRTASSQIKSVKSLLSDSGFAGSIAFKWISSTT